MHFEEETELLYAIFDGANELIEFASDGTVQATYTLPGNDQEGITMTPSCNTDIATVYIAEDVGPEIRKYGSYEITCIVEEENEDTPVDPPTDDPEDPESPVNPDDPENPDDSDDPPPEDPSEEDTSAEIPNKPTNAHKKRVTPRKIRVKWKGNGTYYKVILQTKNQKKKTVFRNVTRNRKIIDRNYIRKNRKYIIHVRACNDAGCSGKSKARKL